MKRFKNLLIILSVIILLIISIGAKVDTKKVDPKMAKDIEGLENYYISTGKNFDSLPENTEVQVFLDEKPIFEYDKIGVVTVGQKFRFKGNNLVTHVQMAKIFALKKGANIVIVKDKQSQLVETGLGYTEKLTTTFELGKTK
ncbi:MAG TPA: hypothetical protein DDY71_09990 [Spirochaetia bacterium]|nr:hypothetical protein [Spirochaetia bacterium]HBI37962.1 hypothetical protein [Spirochaetia bacterium]